MEAVVGGAPSRVPSGMCDAAQIGQSAWAMLSLAHFGHQKEHSDA